MTRIANMLKWLAYISLAILGGLVVLFARGQFAADKIHARAGSLHCNVVNGWGTVQLSLKHNSKRSTPLRDSDQDFSLTYHRERVINHSMFWLSDGNPFGIGFRTDSHGVEIELDMGLLFLLTGAIPCYRYFNLRRTQQSTNEICEDQLDLEEEEIS